MTCRAQYRKAKGQLLRDIVFAIRGGKRNLLLIKHRNRTRRDKEIVDDPVHICFLALGMDGEQHLCREPFRHILPMCMFLDRAAGQLAACHLDLRGCIHSAFPAAFSIGAYHLCCAVGKRDRHLHSQREIPGSQYAKEILGCCGVALVGQTEDTAVQGIFALSQIRCKLYGVVIPFLRRRTTGTECGAFSVDEELVTGFRRDMRLCRSRCIV